MKRYTLKFRSLLSSATTRALYEELEQVLLRLHPKITYKIRQVADDKDGMLLVEIALEGKRELLEAALKSREWNVPVRLESMGWGWLTEYKEEMPATPSTSGIDIDPLAPIIPVDGQVEFRLSKRRLWLRYIFLLICTSVVILLLVANAYLRYSPLLEGIYIVGFLVWLIVLNETPFDIRLYAAKVSCSQEGLSASYWYSKLPTQIRWDEMWGLNFSEPVCQVFGENKKMRFLISDRFGCKEQKVVLKTIVERACLNYVMGNFMTMEYRRYDA